MMAASSSLIRRRAKWPPRWRLLVPASKLQMHQQEHQQQPRHSRRLLLSTAIPSGCPRSHMRYPCGVRQSLFSHRSTGWITPATSSLHAATAVAALATAAASAGALVAGATIGCGGAGVDSPLLAPATACIGCATAQKGIRAAACTGVGDPCCAAGAGACGGYHTPWPAIRAARTPTAVQLLRRGASTLQRTRQEPSCSGIPSRDTSRLPLAYVRGTCSGWGNSGGRTTPRGSDRGNSRRGSSGSVKKSSSLDSGPNSTPRKYSSSGSSYCSSMCSGNYYYNVLNRWRYSSCRHGADRQYSKLSDGDSKHGESSSTEANQWNWWRCRSDEEKGKKDRRSSRSNNSDDSDRRRNKRARAQAAAGTCFAPVYLHDGHPEESDVVNKKGLRLRTYVWKPCHCNASTQRRQHAATADKPQAPGAAATTAAPAGGPSATAARIAAPPAEEPRDTKQKSSRALGWTRELVEDASATGSAPAIRCSSCGGVVRGVVLLVHGFGEHCRGQFLSKPLGPLPAVDGRRISESRRNSTCTTSGCSTSREVNSSTDSTVADCSADPCSLTGIPSSRRVDDPIRSSSATNNRDSHSGSFDSTRDESNRVHKAAEGSKVKRKNDGGEERALIDTQLHYSGSWIERLNVEGFIVVGYDFQGHGMSEGWRGHRCCVEDMDDYARDVLLLLRLTQLRFGGGGGAAAAASNQMPLYVVSVSMGAWATARALQLAADSRERQALLSVIKAAAAAAQTVGPASRAPYTPAEAEITAAGIVGAAAGITRASRKETTGGPHASPEESEVAATAEEAASLQATAEASTTTASTDRAAAVQERGFLCSLLGSRVSPSPASSTPGATTMPDVAGCGDQEQKSGSERPVSFFVEEHEPAAAPVSFLTPVKHKPQATHPSHQDSCGYTCLTESSSTIGSLQRSSFKSPSGFSVTWKRSNSVTDGSSSNWISNSVQSSSDSTTYSMQNKDGRTKDSQHNGSHRSGTLISADAGSDFAAFVHGSLGLEGVVLLSPMFDTERRRQELNWNAIRFAVLPLAFFFPSLPPSYDMLRLPRHMFRARRPPVATTEPVESLQQPGNGDCSRGDNIGDVRAANNQPPTAPGTMNRKNERPRLLAHLLSNGRSQHRSNGTQQQRIRGNLQVESDSSSQQERSSDRRTGEMSSFQRLRDVYLRDPLTYKASPPGSFVVALMRSADAVLLPQQMSKITGEATKRILVIHNAEDPVCDYRGAFLFCQRLLQSASSNTSGSASPAAYTQGAPAAAASSSAAALPRWIAPGAAVGVSSFGGVAAARDGAAIRKEVHWKLVLLNARAALEKARLQEQSLQQRTGAGRQAQAAAAAATTADARVTSKQKKTITAETLSFSAAAAAMSACPQAFLWANKQDGARLLSALLDQQQPLRQLPQTQLLHEGEQGRKADEHTDAREGASRRTARRVISVGASCSAEEGTSRQEKSSSTVEQQHYESRSKHCHSAPQQQEALPDQRLRGSSSRQLQLVEGVGEVRHNLTNEPGADDLFVIIKDWMHTPLEEPLLPPENRDRCS